MFYEFRQNNSGGSFHFDHNRGISVLVVIEAQDLREAVYRAERLGLYFDGVEDGLDCECCGDRWYAPWKDEGSEVPSQYGQPLKDGFATANGGWGGWAEKGKPEAYIHYLDGQVEGVLA